MSKNDPIDPNALTVAPSAKNQCVEGAVTPALSCPAPNWCPHPSVSYIARSTMIGSADWIIADTSVAASSGPSPFT